MILRMLEACAGHLRAETWAWLDAALAEDTLRNRRNERAAWLDGARTRHGWLVRAQEKPIGAQLPENLVSIIEHAVRQGCGFVLIDTCILPNLDLPVLHPDFLPVSPAPPADRQ